MIDKYFGGALPEERTPGPEDAGLIELAEGLSGTVDAYMEKFAFQNALVEIFKVTSRANKYIDETAPWVLAKDESNKGRLAAILYNLLEAVRICTVMLQPFMPGSCAKVFEQIGAGGDLTSFDSAASFGALNKDAAVKKGNIIFPRLDLAKELAALEA
jgi:methionyl-tRNA synthetase